MSMGDVNHNLVAVLNLDHDLDEGLLLTIPKYEDEHH